MHHTRVHVRDARRAAPSSTLVEPPWGDTEWIERQEAARGEGEGLFARWPLLVPQLLEWADRDDQLTSGVPPVS